MGSFKCYSVTVCCLAGVILIGYGFAVAEFARLLRCSDPYSCHAGFSPERGVALSSCMVALLLIEFVLAFASAIYSCCSVPSGAEGQLVSISQKLSC